MNVMLSGGGTGGHIYPALAVAEAIRQKYPTHVWFMLAMLMVWSMSWPRRLVMSLYR